LFSLSELPFLIDPLSLFLPPCCCALHAKGLPGSFPDSATAAAQESPFAWVLPSRFFVFTFFFLRRPNLTRITSSPDLSMAKSLTGIFFSIFFGYFLFACSHQRHLTLSFFFPFLFGGRPGVAVSRRMCSRRRGGGGARSLIFLRSPCWSFITFFTFPSVPLFDLAEPKCKLWTPELGAPLAWPRVVFFFVSIKLCSPRVIHRASLFASFPVEPKQGQTAG